MGSRTMLSSNGGRTPQFQPLVRQNSLYNLTLDEVQNQLGDTAKPLSSMNMDELLKNIWTAEESQAMAMAMGNGPINGISPNPSPSPGNTGLQRQGSLTLPRTLSRKTVDEVWRDIQQNQGKSNEEKKPQQRQPTFGEMTLEDFLVKAGVVREDNNTVNNINITDTHPPAPVCTVSPAPIGMDAMAAAQNFQQHADWIQYQLNTVQQQQQQQQQQSLLAAYGAKRAVPQTTPLAIPGNPLLEGGYGDNQLSLSSPLMGGTSSDSQTPGRKRGAPESIIEKTVERRQKRMIKNRESAARSRARKQAYTNELENEVMQLKEENERLKKQQTSEWVMRNKITKYHEIAKQVQSPRSTKCPDDSQKVTAV
eukprot:Gb_20987 [translate_table: standard]